MFGLRRKMTEVVLTYVTSFQTFFFRFAFRLLCVELVLGEGGGGVEMLPGIAKLVQSTGRLAIIYNSSRGR